MTNTLPPDPEQRNDRRADWVRLTLLEFRAMTLCDDENVVCDFLADLAHYCDRADIDFAHEFRRASSHYRAETEERGKQFCAFEAL